MSVGLIFSVALAFSAGATQSIDVEPVWSGHPVGFSLLTHGNHQFVAYYDAERRMKVASRELGAPEWEFVELPEKLGWDSHNYVTMAVDDDGHLHLSGNMHVKPLMYFRTTRPLDITSFERAGMVGEKEDRMTYPKFFRGPGNALVYTYRDGSSGKGDQIYNVYDCASKQWRRLIDAPLLSGEGKMNAYLNGPVKGPDGRFHLCWVWRDTPDCETNHDPGYAVSTDFVRWETAAGKPLELPITLEKAGVVDAVPPGGGIINGNVKLGFDSQNRPVVSYHKYDAAGNTQIYNARFENGAWKIVQATNWDYRWEFSGRGSIGFELGIGGVSPCGGGRLKQTCRQKDWGRAELLLDEDSLELIQEQRQAGGGPKAAGKVKTGLQKKQAGDLGHAPAGVSYHLEWETLPANRDRARDGEPPKPSMLRMVKEGP